MATKIRYNVHTTNKYSVFDSDNSEETENKNLKKLTKNENNNMCEKINNNDEIKKSNELKSNNSIVNKEYSPKEVTNQNNDRYKYAISSLNDVNENAYRNYRDNFHTRGNIRNKFPRRRGGGYNNISANIIGSNNFYRGSRNYDYKMNIDRRNYNNSYNYNKFDFREKVFNEYNENNCKYDNLKRENFLDIKNKNYDENLKSTRKHESVTIDYDMYRRQQEKKLNSNKIIESTDKKKKKNEINNEKKNKINNAKRNDMYEENKIDHPKRKAVNVYQYILDEGGRVDRIPGFRRSFRNFRKVDEGNWINKNDKTKTLIDEKIFKKRDPPNIDDTRAFPSLTSK